MPYATGLALSPAIIKLERASRELAATFVYQGLIQGCDPLELFDNEDHQTFWWDRGAKAVARELDGAAVEKSYAPTPKAPAVDPGQSFNSPLLANRARRAAKKTTTPPPALQTPPPVPAGAQPEGEATSASDGRSGASRALVRAKLVALSERRHRYEMAIDAQLDPVAAPDLPAFDVALLLLFLCELEVEKLPVPVACKEAVQLSLGYSEGGHRHVQGILGAYAREQLGYVAPQEPDGEGA